MTTFVEGRRTGQFLVDGDELPEFTRAGGWADGTLTMQSGTPVAVRVSDGLIVAWNHGATSGTGPEVLAGLLYTPTAADAASPNVRVSYVARGPLKVSSSYGRIPLLFSNTKAQLVAALAALNIIVAD